MAEKIEPAQSGSISARPMGAVSGSAIKAMKAASTKLSRVMISRVPPRTQPAAAEARMTRMAKASKPVMPAFSSLSPQAMGRWRGAPSRRDGGGDTEDRSWSWQPSSDASPRPLRLCATLRATSPFAKRRTGRRCLTQYLFCEIRSTASVNLLTDVIETPPPFTDNGGDRA